MRFVIGIDPGLTGGVAVYGGRRKELLSVTPLPVIGKEIDGVQFSALLESEMVDLGLACPTMIYIERQQAMPKQGVSSSFQTGRNYGVLLGVMKALRYPHLPIASGSWKRGVGLPAGADKSASRALASNLMPTFAPSWARKKDDGLAEAALIARWGFFKGE